MSTENKNNEIGVEELEGVAGGGDPSNGKCHFYTYSRNAMNKGETLWMSCSGPDDCGGPSNRCACHGSDNCVNRQHRIVCPDYEPNVLRNTFYPNPPNAYNHPDKAIRMEFKY